MIRVSDYNHTLYEIAQEGEFGKWTLKKTVDEKGTDLYCYTPERGCIYKDQADDAWKGVELTNEWGTMMTDNPFEQESYKPAIDLARGTVLVSGLGIGLFNVLAEDKIKAGAIARLDIVELSKDLADWVTGYIPMMNTRVMVSDIQKYIEKTDETYDFIFLDIWPADLAAVLEGPLLAERSRRCLKPDGTVKYWMEGIPPMMGYFP